MQAQRYKIPSTNALLARVLLELLALFCFGYPMLHIYVFLQGDAEPYHRGFYCDDESIKHPNLPEEISVGNCVIIWICIVVFFVILIEVLHFRAYKYEEWEQQISEQHSQESWHCLGRIPLVVVELYRMLGYFFIGALGALLTTEMAKYKIGRLRPFFLTVCDIELKPELCLDDFGYNKFVTDYECTNPNVDEVREARKSFLSGHSSFSFYCATFLIIYFQARLSRRQYRHCSKREGTRICKMVLKVLKVLRPFFQFGFFALALYIAFTRISDYKHHPTDILAGIVVGIVFALIILLFLVDLFKRPRSFEEQLDEYDFLGIQMENLLSPRHGIPMTNSTGIGPDPESNRTSVNEVDAGRSQRQQLRQSREQQCQSGDQSQQPSSSRSPQGLAPLARYDDDVQPRRMNKVS